jgi:long-subunit acyl-CoA synthetase (AMP-forming)
VEVAFEKFAKDGKAKIHRASPILGGRKPGIFKYYSVQIDVDLDKQPTLVNQEDETCLLLRTSGTTARPKGVPLSQGALVTNGAIIAKSMVGSRYCSRLTNYSLVSHFLPLFLCLYHMIVATYGK